jgi:hypothetical protein
MIRGDPMAPKLTAGLLAAVLIAGCQSSDPNSSMETQDSVASEPSPFFEGMEVVRASADYEPVLNYPGICLSEDELVAAQLVRLHTELMVTGLTCRAAYRDQGLFDQYQTFTVTHQDRLRDGQEVLARYLARFQNGNPARLYDRFRTQMANYEGQVVMDLTASNYCRQQYNRFYTLVALDEPQLDSYLQAAMTAHRNHYENCGSAELAPASRANPG